MIRLIDQSAGLVLAEITAAQRDTLQKTLTRSDASTAYYLDSASLSALRDAVSIELDTTLRGALEARVEALTEAQVDAFIDEVLPAHDIMGLPDVVKEALAAQVEVVFSEELGSLCAPLAEAALGGDSAGVLAKMTSTVKLNAVKQLLQEMPLSALRPKEHKVLFDYNHLFNFGGTIISVDKILTPVNETHRVLDLPSDADINPDENFRAQFHELLISMLRELLVQLDSTGKRAALRDDFDLWYEKIYFVRFFNQIEVDHAEALKGLQHLARLEARVESTEGFDLLCIEGDVEYRLEVVVARGKDLVVQDVFSSDPYCVLTLRGRAGDAQRAQTRVVKRDLNPVWNQGFHFICASDAVLDIEVLDMDRFSADDPMGRTQLTVSECAVGEVRTLERRLEGVKSGVLTLEVELHDLEQIF